MVIDNTRPGSIVIGTVPIHPGATIFGEEDSKILSSKNNMAVIEGNKYLNILSKAGDKVFSITDAEAKDAVEYINKCNDLNLLEEYKVKEEASEEPRSAVTVAISKRVAEIKKTLKKRANAGSSN